MIEAITSSAAGHVLSVRCDDTATSSRSRYYNCSRCGIPLRDVESLSRLSGVMGTVSISGKQRDVIHAVPWAGQACGNFAARSVAYVKAHAPQVRLARIERNAGIFSSITERVKFVT